MKRTQRIDLLTTIKGTAVSFFSVLMFVALGVGVFLGIHWTSGALQTMADDALEKGRGHDLEVTYAYGFTDDDLAKLSGVEGVDEVEAGYVAYRNLKVSDGTIVVKAHVLPERIDTFLTCEGTIPEHDDEVALEATWARECGIGLGDEVELEKPSEDGDTEYLTRNTFTVAALVTSPAYLATSTDTYGSCNVGSGSVDGVAWLREGAFDADAFSGAKPYVTIRSKTLAGLSSFDDAYRSQSQELCDRVEELGKELAHERFEDLRDQAQSELDEASETVAHAQSQLEEQRAQLDASSEQIAQTEAALGPAADSNEELAQAKAQLAEGEQKYADAVADADEAQEKLDAQQEDLDNMLELQWSVLQRRCNAGVATVTSYADVMRNLRWSMASLFLIVGLFVCYSAMSRIVYDQTTRIGTKKALGFRQREVSSMFLWYATVAVVAGVVVAIPCSLFFVEGVILRTMGTFFVTPATLYLQATDIAVLATIELVLIDLSAWVAVRDVLRRGAVDLLAGQEAPSTEGHFYERWNLWKRLGILAQTTVNNCVNDRRRLVATVVGVAGCTALVVTAVTLRDDVARSLTRQYDAIYHYDMIVSIDRTDEAARSVGKALEDAGMSGTPVLRTTFTLTQPDNTMSSAVAVVPMDEEGFGRFYSVLDAGTGVAGEGEDGVSMSVAYHEHMGAELGDSIRLGDVQGNTRELPIVRFYEFHLMNNEFVMSRALYEDTFGEKAEPNCILVNSGGRDKDEVVSTLQGVDGFQVCVDDKGKNEASFGDFMQIANIVVLVYLSLAVVMAGVVLLNLDMMFVSEKKRELIILMICGYTTQRAKGYIWHDSVVLTALGVVCGLVLGTFAGQASVNSIETSTSSLLIELSVPALAMGVLVSAMLAGAALWWALRLIPKFNLADISEP